MLSMRRAAEEKYRSHMTMWSGGTIPAYCWKTTRVSGTIIPINRHCAFAPPLRYERNGTLPSNGEIMAVLWEDESSDERKKIYFRRLRSDLHTQLDNNVDTILAQQRGML